MKAKLSKATQWLIIATISLLGFSACKPDEELMYGTPTSDYRADIPAAEEGADFAVTPAEKIEE
ncbi:MAG: hypothetical protein E7138_02230 [Rikenellaceae bacterium]|nr:hypothetical protein [Rikenellaceae bacterium]